MVEDVPQVAQYVRGLLNAQQQIKLLDVLTDGRRIVEQVEQLRPDVLMVDALLQGKVKGLGVVDDVRRAGLTLPLVVITVPQHPIAAPSEHGIDRVLGMPFSGFDLVNALNAVVAAHEAAGPTGARVVSVFAPKGGVGKTTIAFNLAVALGQAGRRTALVDGSLQFGDLRALLRVPMDAPSILDLPTDKIKESDLQDVLWRDPSGIDILLAPPRVEMFEMVTTRDIDKVLSLLRRVYEAIVIDTATGLSEVTLAFLDAADLVVEIVTYDSTTLYNTRAVAETFRQIGYPPGKVRYLVNRADSSGGMAPEQLVQALGRAPEYEVVSDGRLVVQSNNEGVPFVLASPEAKISADIVALARSVATLVGAAPAMARARG